MSEPTEEIEKIYVFPLAGEHYGVSLSNVGEVTQARIGEISPVLGSRVLRGLVSLRGRVTPVLDASGLLGLRAVRADAETFPLLVCQNGSCEAAIAADGLGVVAEVCAGELESVDCGPVRHTFRYKEDIVKLLDVQALFEAAAAEGTSA